jgi:uncharacterized protein YndB with AHSA1/START domain
MSNTNGISRTLYVTYIRTPPEKLWDALIQPEFTKQYWFGMHHESEWSAGAPWKLVTDDARVANTGQVIELDRPRKLVITWRFEMSPEMRAEGYSRVTMEIEPAGDVTKLTVTQEIDFADSKLIEFTRGGWPLVLSSLKSLLETGQSLEMTRSLPRGM